MNAVPLLTVESYTLFILSVEIDVLEEGEMTIFKVWLD